jgi:apolipoprotein N-acyltransferase
MLIAAVAAAVVLQLGMLVRPAPLATTHTATLVQQNIPILEPSQWTVDFFQQTLTELASTSAPPSGSPSNEPGLIIWPESPAPFYINDPAFRRTLSDIARRNNAYVVAGVVGVRHSGRADSSSELLNSAALVGPSGEWSARYDKIHLLPFGEYVPFKRLFFFIEKISKEAGDFGRGSERKVFDLGGKKLGVFICYESIFPDEVLLFARNGAQVFANTSNDEWFGDVSAPWQHLNMARMRAIENRRWLLRSTNTGVTASIDPYGRLVAQAPRNTRTGLLAPYALVSETTFYTRHGDLFAYACAIISVAGLLVRFRFRARIS